MRLKTSLQKQDDSLKMAKEVKKILFISLSNLGDIILTTPVLERLYEEFPEAEIDVITGLPGKEIFSRHPAVKNVTVRGKRKGLKGRVEELLEIRRKKYDLVMDLKNSLIPYLAGAKVHSKLSFKRKVVHKRLEHLSKLEAVGVDPYKNNKFFIPVSEEEEVFIKGILLGAEGSSSLRGKRVIINPGAKSHLKRWPEEEYALLADRLISEAGCEVFVIGQQEDEEVVKRVLSSMKGKALDLCGKTSLGALFSLMKNVDLVITNDSAPLHIASAADAPTVAIFGPTDAHKYGPLSGKKAVVRPQVPCHPCERALCKINPHSGCISNVKLDDVFLEAKKLLEV